MEYQRGSSDITQSTAAKFSVKPKSTKPAAAQRFHPHPQRHAAPAIFLARPFVQEMREREPACEIKNHAHRKKCAGSDRRACPGSRDRFGRAAPRRRAISCRREAAAPRRPSREACACRPRGFAGSPAPSVLPSGAAASARARQPSVTPSPEQKRDQVGAIKCRWSRRLRRRPGISLARQRRPTQQRTASGPRFRAVGGVGRCVIHGVVPWRLAHQFQALRFAARRRCSPGGSIAAPGCTR